MEKNNIRYCLHIEKVDSTGFRKKYLVKQIAY